MPDRDTERAAKNKSRVPAQVMIHPTHGDYALYQREGNPPHNLTQVNQLPLTIRTVAGHRLEKDLPEIDTQQFLKALGNL